MIKLRPSTEPAKYGDMIMSAPYRLQCPWESPRFPVSDSAISGGDVIRQCERSPFGDSVRLHIGTFLGLKICCKTWSARYGLA